MTTNRGTDGTYAKDFAHRIGERLVCHFGPLRAPQFFGLIIFPQGRGSTADPMIAEHGGVKLPRTILKKQMTPPQVRDQHIIPRFYLNKFANQKKQVTTYTKDFPTRNRSTKSQCTDFDYFEYEVGGTATANQYENWFQRIETFAGDLYDSLEGGFKTQAEEAAWALFVATLFLRSRKSRDEIGILLGKQILSEEFVSEDQIKDLQHELLKQGELVFADDLRRMVQQIKKEMAAPAFTQLAGIEATSRMLVDNIIGKRWFVFQAGENAEFVTSDCPVSTMTFQTGAAKLCLLGGGFGYADTAIALPLSPTRLFLAGPSTMSWKSNILDKAAVMSFNTCTIRFAEHAVYGLNKGLEIEALVKSDINKAIFGENVFIPASTAPTP